MSLFKQLAGANGIIEWTDANRLRLKNELKKRFLKDPVLDMSQVDYFLDALEDKVGSTNWGPSGGINEKEMKREIWELKSRGGDKFSSQMADRIDDILFGS